MILDDFLAAPNKKNPSKTNWEDAYETWMAANDYDGSKLKNYMETRKIKKIEKPDYTTLKNTKEGTIHEPKK